MIDFEYNYIHNEALRLTGDEWCPYPDASLYLLMVKSSDLEKISIIEDRRKKIFPYFLCGKT